MSETFGIIENKRYIVSEVADILGISSETVRNYARNRQIGYFKYGKRGDYYFPGTEIIKFLKKHFHPAD